MHHDSYIRLRSFFFEFEIAVDFGKWRKRMCSPWAGSRAGFAVSLLAALAVLSLATFVVSSLADYAVSSLAASAVSPLAIFAMLSLAHYLRRHSLPWPVVTRCLRRVVTRYLCRVVTRWLCRVVTRLLRSAVADTRCRPCVADEPSGADLNQHPMLRFAVS